MYMVQGDLSGHDGRGRKTKCTCNAELSTARPELVSEKSKGVVGKE